MDNSLVSEGEDLIVSFQVKNEAQEFCEQWQYHVATEDVWQTGNETKCFFDMDE
jgi:hypothetical protein